MDTREAKPGRNGALSLRAAAELIAGESLSIHDAEVMLVHVVEHGELAANIKRWATEQWAGDGLPGNINHQETSIARADLEAWRERRLGAGRIPPGAQSANGSPT